MRGRAMAMNMQGQPADTTLSGQYTGERGSLFTLAVITAVLTTVTFGLYRFWAKTRIRRYIWSSVGDGRDAFEYTGTGFEKLLGFLVAVVFLAIYLGIVQMILFYFGMSLFVAPETPEQVMMQSSAAGLTFLAVVPLIFFAQYRVRRYKMARTRWRGIRFGMEKGAWGYALRAMGHWMLTILSLGLLLPWQTFRLERYMADRSWYGDAPLQQGGKWTALFPAMSHIYFGLLIMLAGGGLAAAMSGPQMGAAVAVAGAVWFVTGVVIYRVKAFRYLTSNKVLDGNIWFEARTEPANVVATFVFGGIMVALVSALLFGGLGVAIFFLVMPAVMIGQGAVFIAVVVIILLYLLAFAANASLALVWIVQPIIHHVIETTSVNNADELDFIQQRDPDSGADAEGFADALDVGGAI